MAAIVDTESVEKEILILKATGDETVSYLKKYPVVPYEDSFMLKLYRKPLNVTDPIVLKVNDDFMLDHEKGSIQYLIELSEDEMIYIQNYEHETVYYKYLSSLRDTIGDNNFENLRYGTDVLLRYFHKAVFEKVVPIAGSDWTFTLDPDVDRIEETIDDTQLGFITVFAGLLIQEAELRTALRRAIIISDRSSRLDTTKHLGVMQSQVENDNEKLSYGLDQYLITKGFFDGSLLLAFKSDIKNRTIIDYEGNAVLLE
jgi:hypothetical protein